MLTQSQAARLPGVGKSVNATPAILSDPELVTRLALAEAELRAMKDSTMHFRVLRMPRRTRRSRTWRGSNLNLLGRTGRATACSPRCGQGRTPRRGGADRGSGPYAIAGSDGRRARASPLVRPAEGPSLLKPQRPADLTLIDSERVALTGPTQQG